MSRHESRAADRPTKAATWPLLWLALSMLTTSPARAVYGEGIVTGETAPPVTPATRRLRTLSPEFPQGGTASRWLPAGTGGRLFLDRDVASHPLAAGTLSLLAVETDKAWRSSPQFEIVAVAETPRVTFARGRQIVRGRPVLGSLLTVAWRASGRPVFLRTDAFPGADAVWPAAAWRADQAGIAALRSLPFTAVEWESSEEAWLPVADDDGGPSLLPAWNLRFRTEGPPGRWEARVHAGTGALVSRHSLLAFESVEGTVEALVEPGVPGDPQVVIPVEAAAVTAVSGQFFAADTTGPGGGYSLVFPRNGRARVTAELRGRRVWVRDASRGLRTPLDTATVSVPGNAVFRFDERNSTLALRDAYYHLVRAYRFTRTLDPGPALARLDRPMEARVDDPNGGCNAYWNGTRLNFYAAGGGCVSTARIADVVFHEYGHAVTQDCYQPWDPPGDMNEAFSDYFAATLTDQPRIGNGFFGPGSFLRDVDRDRVWPRDASPSIHLQGLILAGALWDLRRDVGAAVADPLFHYARYGAAGSFDDYLLDLLAVDDDDGDLGNGTPHFDAIIRAFRAHGIGDYAVHVTHAPLPDLEDPARVIEARAVVRSLLGLAPDSLAFFYATGDAFTRVVPRATGASREFAAEIPTPAPGTSIRYYWAAADTAGHAARLPVQAPDSCFVFFVGTDTIPPSVGHEPLEAVTRDLVRLTLHASLGDNSYRVGPAFAEVHYDAGAPVVTPFTWLGGGEYRAEVPLLPPPGGDTLTYRLTVLDTANEPNLAAWPTAGEQTVPIRRGQTLTFEDGPGDLTPDAGWEWGIPASPVLAWSGDRAWATGLADGYADNASWSLAWGPLDLGGWDRGRLEFMHRYRSEAGYDGGSVEWAAQADGPWLPLVPTGGYPSALVRALEAAGFSGDSEGWKCERFALDRFLGQTAWIRFRFESDARVHDLGWVIDDVTIIAAQARAIPASLHAEECGPDCVRLRWLAPPDVDTTSARFLGYEVRRAEGDGPYGDSPIHPHPLRSVSYLDTGLTTGSAYHYQLVALYDEGPSAPRLATATPAAPALGLDLAEIVYELRGTARSDTSFLVQNRTGGVLRVNTYLGEAGQSADSVRLAYPCRGDTSWNAVWEDAIDAGAPTDLAGIDLRERTDPEIGPVLEIRLRGHGPWGGPSTWGGLVLIDTDDNISTGLAEINLGADFLIAFGVLAREAGDNGPTVLLDSSFRPISRLTGGSIAAGVQPVLLAVPHDLLGAPASVRVAVRLAATLRGEPYDRAPETPRLPWLSREPRFGRASVGHPQPVALNFDATAVGNGTYGARLFLETNDQTDPLRVVPVTLRVSGLIPDEVQNLQFEALDHGLLISFRLPADLPVTGVAVERSDADPIRWSVRTPEPLHPDSSGVVRFLDVHVEPDRAYLYRFRVMYEATGLVLYGPYATTYAPTIPATLRLSPPRPNPLVTPGTGVELRLDLPTAGPVRLEAFDPGGRRVRLLLAAALPAGTRYLSWNGRNESGHPLSAGVYWIRLATARGERSTRLVVVR